MIYSPPQILPLTVDLHEHLVEVPSPPAGSHALYPAFPDLGGEDRTEPVPPVPDRIVTDIDTVFVQQILHVAKRKRETDIQHER